MGPGSRGLRPLGRDDSGEIMQLLVNIIVVAVLSTPAFAYFGADRLNTFVTDVPFVWLPAVMVAAALAGHLIIARALLR